VSIGEKSGEVFLGRDITSMGNISPAQAELIDHEVRGMVLGAFEIAERVIRFNTDSMEEIVETLIEQETLSGVALEAMLSGVRPYEGDLSLNGNRDGSRP
jgi:cell division protease FtsH